ncbi:hypothetical protein [Endozoicomonas sp. Mp262]
MSDKLFFAVKNIWLFRFSWAWVVQNVFFAMGIYGLIIAVLLLLPCC